MKQQREKAIDIRKIGAIIEKNWVVLTRDKTRLLPLILFPIFMILVFGYTTGNIPKHIPAVIVDYDNSLTSQHLIQEISASDVLSIRYIASTEGEARNLLDSMEVRAIIEIPQNLEDDVNSGRQAGITLLVDESDSAVRSTVTSTMEQIIHSYAVELSIQRLTAYQQSVFGQAQMLSAYTVAQGNAYSGISQQLQDTQPPLTKAKRNMDSAAYALTQSLGEPSVFIPPDGTLNLASNDTIVIKPIGYAATQSQIAMMQQTSALIGTAQAKVTASQATAARASQAAMQRQDYRTVEQNVNEPMQKIGEFAGADTQSILIPVQLQEKPAYGTGKRPIDFLIASIIALTIFQGAIMGMGRAVAGEKREGSLTRVFLTPTSNTTIVLGTLIFYILFEIFRSTFLIFVSILFFNISLEGNPLLIALIVIIYAGVSTAIGMIISSMVRTEQQYFAMSMLISMPTIFLAGVFFPLQAMPRALQILAGFLPVTYAGQALSGVMSKGLGLSNIAYPVIILFIFLTVLIAILLAVFKRAIE